MSSSVFDGVALAVGRKALSFFAAASDFDDAVTVPPLHHKLAQIHDAVEDDIAQLLNVQLVCGR